MATQCIMNVIDIFDEKLFQIIFSQGGEVRNRIYRYVESFGSNINRNTVCYDHIIGQSGGIINKNLLLLDNKSTVDIV